MITPITPGRRRSILHALLITGLSCAPALAQTITQAEPDDSIGTANQTGLTAGSTGLKVAYGNNGDGSYGVGETGDSSGDMDFYKVSAAAGQAITVNINNAGSNPDFDSYVGLYYLNGAEAVVVAENDDRADTTKGYDRTSELTYTAAAAGDYYVCVSNYIEAGSLPGDPLTPGTGLGAPAGTPGPYQLLIGLGAVPVPDFLGSLTGYAIPPLETRKVAGLNWARGTLSLRNAGPAPWTITAYSITGPNASQFLIYGMPPAFTLAPGAIRDVTVYYDSRGTSNMGEAALNFTSNDSANLTYALNASGKSQFNGGGKFAVKKVPLSAGTVEDFARADAVLAGTDAGTAVETTAVVINYGEAANGNFGGDAAFPGGNTDQFVVLVTGTIFIKEAGLYTFLGYSDDGQRLRIDGNDVFELPTANANSFGSVELTAGTHTVEFVMYEGAGGNSAELAISRDQGEFAAFGDSTWELLEAYSPDADGDGIGDALEADYGTNPAVADITSDLDSDGLNNISEILFRTGISDDDSDDDTLKDGVETNTGVWAGTGNTGTNPLVTDTDKDGLSDAAENPELAFMGLTQPGTDPNEVDSDTDGIADLGEITIGTSPKDALSVPVFTFQPYLGENFDSAPLNSEYSFTTSAGTFIPDLVDTGVAARGNAAQITDNVAGSNNAIAFNTVDLPASPAVQLSFDFRMTPMDGNIADGFGIGFFRSPANGGTDARNPGAGKNWENPASAGGGFGDAVVFGFGVYGGDFIRLTGSQSPATNLAEVAAPFTLTNSITDPVTEYFNRAIITVITNDAFSSMVKLEVIQNVDGAATRHVVMDNVLVPGFNISTETFRVIAGGRTGQFYIKTELDNVTLAAAATPAPSLALFTSLNSLEATVYDSTANAVAAASVKVTVNGAEVAATATKTGTVTSVSYTTPAAAFLPGGLNTAVITYSDTQGTAYTETRAFFTDPYFLMPPALALPAAAAGTGGFSLYTVQMDLLLAGNTPNFLDYAEGILDGVSGTPFEGGNKADLTGAVNGRFLSEVINFEQAAGAAGFFAEDTLIPGIPETSTISDPTDNVVMEALTWINFPSAGLYRFGVTRDDGFRVSVGHEPVPAVSIVSPASAARILPVVPGIRNHPAGGGLAAPYPTVPVTAKVVAAVPIDGSTALTNAAEIAGNIALIDRGNGTFALKLLNAQAAGAIAVILVNETQLDTVPGVMGGDGAGVNISGVMISKGDGDALKALLAANPGAVQVRYGVDNSRTLGEANLDGTTEFSAVVSTPGLYPVRLLYYEGGGGAGVEWYSIDDTGVKHLLNDPDDASALKAYSTVSAVGTGPSISITGTGGALQIQFTGTLQASPNLTGFTDVTGATSPYTVPAGAPARMFYRARQ